MPVPIRVEELTPCTVYCRDEVRVPVVWLLRGLGENAGRTVAVEIDGYGNRVVDTEPLDVPDARMAPFPLKPSHLMPGTYAMKLYVADGRGGSWLLRRPFEVAPARVRWDNLQVLSWNHYNSRNPDFGITISQAHADEHVDRNSRQGMYSQNQLGFTRRGYHLPGVRAVLITSTT